VNQTLNVSLNETFSDFFGLKKHFRVIERRQQEDEDVTELECEAAEEMSDAQVVITSEEEDSDKS